MRYETAKKYVLKHHPTAEEYVCHLGCITWYIVRYRDHYNIDIGASRKNIKLAWIHAANIVKQIVSSDVLLKLES